MEKMGGNGLSLARRLYTSRAIGLVLGLLCVSVTMYPLNPAPWVWALMLFNGLLWPHLAYQWARRSTTPYHAEHRNLLVDAFMGGFWVAAMHFNPLPSATTISMMAMNNVAIGGLRFLLVGTVAQILGIGVGGLIFLPLFIPETSQFQLYACLPLMCFYPLVLGLICFRQAHTLGRQKRELLALSRTDSLTGLLNHGAWKDQLEVEFQRCQRQHQGAVIALIDIDHFKSINDTYGHVAGDIVLRHLSKMLKQNLRATDVAGRYGGDEFCVILPDLPLNSAAAAMDALRDRFATLGYEQNPALKVSLSIGLADFDPAHTDATLWLNDADQALYEAKTTGRNRVICCGDGRPHHELLDSV
ncbi:diguanylate cyclase [Pseudomonas sp. PCH199]|uniref:diguanylate cyclase n=1 Tax=unclassified Pseudomonas TaxID=196821 RepID=UPI000BD49D6B|nr:MULTISPECIES: diguanylate cyclase [unclassified Pseudomonas]MCW8278163.1 diguanylate cyclase [Pseudomonas sp. PCH199]PAM81641.1 diguanylate cyclase AdrA [Pseudomonas sp. ERMR1:02]